MVCGWVRKVPLRWLPDDVGDRSVRVTEATVGADRCFVWRRIFRFLGECMEDMGRMALAGQGFLTAPWVPSRDAGDGGAEAREGAPPSGAVLQGPPPGHPESLCGRPMDETERWLWRLLLEGEGPR